MTPHFPRRATTFGPSLLDFAQEAGTETFMASPWARLVSLATRVELGGGEWLFRAGESGDSVYVVLWGRLEEVAELPEPATIAILGRGEAVGELALLTGAPHAHSVRALRDSSLLRIARADFDRVLAEDPDYAVSLMRGLAGRLREVTARALPIDPIPRTIAIVPVCHGADVAGFARDLASSLGRLALVAELTGVPGEDVPAGILDRAERKHDHVLLIASQPPATTPGRASRSAPPTGSSSSRTARRCHRSPTGASRSKGCDLVVLKARAGAWVDQLHPRAIHNLPEGPTPPAIGRLARRLAGRSIGLVLSGGGARAFSHLGVLDELAAAGVTVDRVAGCSMGGFIAALHAQGRSADEVTEVVREEFVRRNLLRDYTLPIAALLRHRRAFAMAQRVFGDARIEELPIDYFCVSCDLLTAELVVHRRGLVWLASGASMNLPAIYPPLPLEGRLLVDGGVLNNLPADVMAAVGEGPVIAADATSNSDLRSGARRSGGVPWVDRAMRRARHVMVGTLGPVPSIKETLIRSMVLGSANTAMNAQQHADFVITAVYVSQAACGLASRGIDVSILVTEPERSYESKVEQHGNIPVRSVPHSPHDRASDVLLSLIRYLEENAPCVYVSNRDFRAALVSPRLSNRVSVIGVLHEATDAEYDHCARLGEFWNAIVIRDPNLRQRIIGEYPRLASRLAEIDENDLGREYASLMRSLDERGQSGLYRRQRRRLSNPPSHLMPGMSDREIATEVSRVNAVPLWPDVPHRQAPTVRSADKSRSLKDHRIVLAVPTGRVSGVDVFSVNLARELIRQGYNAELVQTAPDAWVADRLPLPDDVPVSRVQTRQFPTWRERWSAMREHLERRGPCIFIPNYDTSHSCITPTLSSNVKVVGIGHSDDAQHYAHILHLAPYWDAVVGVSHAVTNSIAALAPGIESRQWTIPYGIPVPDRLPERRRDPDGRLLAVYTGRVVRFQKRALDLLSIAQLLQESNSNVELTVAGTGTELLEFLGGASSLILSRHMRYVGGVTNEEVLKLVSESDVFVLPSSFEGLPLSLLEAMAHGCVPVVTRIRSGVPEVVRDGENGFLVPIGGIREFTERILQLSSNPEMLARMRKNAYETVRANHGVEKMTSSYLEVFDKVVTQPVTRPRGKVLPPPSLSGIQAIMPRFPMPLRRVVWRLRGKGI